MDKFIVVKHNSEIFKAACGNSLERFSSALERSNSDHSDRIANQLFSITNGQRLTVLMEAVRWERFDNVKYLLEKYDVDVNIAGTIRQINAMTLEGATALLLAAANGCFEIVKILIDYGATVDCLTTAKWTPLQVACYYGHANVVEYLIERGANVNLLNLENMSCLMVSSERGHTDVVKCLLNNGAFINLQSKNGNTALHFAIYSHKMDIVDIILDYKPLHLKNHISYTPIILAAVTLQYTLVERLIDVLNLSREEIIEIKELLGASYLHTNNLIFTHYNVLGFTHLMQAMEMRYKNPVILKKDCKPNEKYNNQVECHTKEELMNLQDNDVVLFLESLIIKERILGYFDGYMLNLMIYRGMAYLKSFNFTLCSKFWNLAVKISLEQKISICKHYFTFAQELCYWIASGKNIDQIEFKMMLRGVIEELKTIQEKKMSPESMSKEENDLEAKCLRLAFDFINLTIKVLPEDYCEVKSKDPTVIDIIRLVVELIKLKLKTKTGKTLLHLCVDPKTYTISLQQICKFPNYLATKLLIFCGANVNEADEAHDTPLHYIGYYMKSMKHFRIPFDNEKLSIESVVKELINSGAHTDYVNMRGDCPHTGYLKILLNWTSQTPLKLSCLSARALKNLCPEESYRDKLPITLKEFTNLHGTGY